MNRINMGVTFGTKHSYNDMGLILASKSLGYPEVKSRYIEIPGRDGDLDETEILTGRPSYGNRDITLTFILLNKEYRDWQAVMSEIAVLIHGKKMRIVFDDDKAYYYEGRCSLDPITCNKKAGKVVVKINAETYKKAVVGYDEPWLWDPFDFVYGVINDTYEKQVSGTLTVMFDTFEMPETLTIESNVNMDMTYGDTTYHLTPGVNVLYSVLLTQGTHTLVFTGNGKVTVRWTGGRL